MFETVNKNLMNNIPLGTYCKTNQFTIMKNMIHPYRIFMFIDHVYEAKTGFWFGKTHLFQSIKFANLWKKLHFFFLCIFLKPNYMYNTRQTNCLDYMSQSQTLGDSWTNCNLYIMKLNFCGDRLKKLKYILT